MNAPIDSQGLSRRLFISGAGTVAVLAGAPIAAAASLPPAASAAPAALASALSAARESEAPELLKIAADLVLAKQRFADAGNALDEAKERALAADPPIPEGLPVPFGISIFGSISWYGLPEPADVLGNPIELPPYRVPGKDKTLPVRIPRPSDVVRDRGKARGYGGLGGVSPWHRGDHRRLYDLAVAYEAEIDRVREASGLNDAEFEYMFAGTALVTLCRSATEINARTVTGVVIKAQAIDACADVPGEFEQERRLARQ